MGKVLPKKKSFRSKIYSPKLALGSHIDNVRHSLEHLIFSNEKETESVLLKKRIKVVVFITLISMAVGSFFSPHGKAEVATFYPTACLGGWNNPHHAEGMPETLDNTPSFSFANSASLAKDVLADLYCGTFKGDIPTETVPTKIMLTIAWKGMSDEEVEPITGTSFASSSLDILDATSSPGFTLENSSSTDATSTEVKPVVSEVHATTTESVNPPATPLATSTPDTIAPTTDTTKKEVLPVVVPEVITPSTPPAETIPTVAPQSFLHRVGSKILALLVESVYALDTTMASSSESVSGSSSPMLITSSSTISATSTADASSSTEKSLIDTLLGTKVTNPTLEVLYTLDGVTWMSLGKVRAEDMSYNVFEIPVTATSTWEDISNIQIKVASLLSTDKKPTIFIDGMALNVEYTKIVPTDINQSDNTADQKKYDMSLDSMQGNISAIVATDTDQGTMLNISSAPGSLSVYKDATGDVVYSSGLGSESLTMNSYMFDPGTFTVVVSVRENGCLGLTAKECEADKDTIGSANFTITPSVNTPVKYVHTQ